MASTPPPSANGPAKPRSLTPIILILAITLAPFVFGTLAYYMPSLGLSPTSTTNYGTLVQPQRPMPSATELPLVTLEGEPFDLTSLKGQWLLVSADASACPEECVRKLFVLRNSHASQGKHVDRISRVWFVTDDGKVSDEILEAYKGTVMLRADPARLTPFLAPDAAAGNEAALKAPMWIIDPLGNLMMQFPPDADPIEVRDDIIKLLKNSRIG